MVSSTPSQQVSPNTIQTQAPGATSNNAKKPGASTLTQSPIPQAPIQDEFSKLGTIDPKQPSATVASLQNKIPAQGNAPLAESLSPSANPSEQMSDAELMKLLEDAFKEESAGTSKPTDAKASTSQDSKAQTKDSQAEAPKTPDSKATTSSQDSSSKPSAEKPASGHITTAPQTNKSDNTKKQNSTQTPANKQQQKSNQTKTTVSAQRQAPQASTVAVNHSPTAVAQRPQQGKKDNGALYTIGGLAVGAVAVFAAYKNREALKEMFNRLFGRSGHPSTHTPGTAGTTPPVRNLADHIQDWVSNGAETMSSEFKQQYHELMNKLPNMSDAELRAEADKLQMDDDTKRTLSYVRDWKDRLSSLATAGGYPTHNPIGTHQADTAKNLINSALKDLFDRAIASRVSQAAKSAQSGATSDITKARLSNMAQGVGPACLELHSALGGFSTPNDAEVKLLKAVLHMDDAGIYPGFGTGTHAAPPNPILNLREAAMHIADHLAEHHPHRPVAQTVRRHAQAWLRHETNPRRTDRLTNPKEAMRSALNNI